MSFVLFMSDLNTLFNKERTNRNYITGILTENFLLSAKVRNPYDVTYGKENSSCLLGDFFVRSCSFSSFTKDEEVSLF